jgi:hypothetical protein
VSKSEDTSNEPATSAFTSRQTCRLCVHYRMRSATVLFSAGELAAPGVLKALNQWDQQRAQRASQLLAAVVDTTEAAVSAALGKIVEDEQKQRDSEAEFKRARATTEQEAWPRQPVMSSYCGRREGEGVYLIAEIRNRGGHCGDYQEGRPARKACLDCGNRVAAAGTARDGEREDLITQMHAEATSAQASTASPEGMLKAHREGVSARKAFELSGAYAADGRLAYRPEYLDYCRALSTDGEYAVCAIVNAHNSCTTWKPSSADHVGSHGHHDGRDQLAKAACQWHRGPGIQAAATFHRGLVASDARGTGAEGAGAGENRPHPGRHRKKAKSGHPGLAGEQAFRARPPEPNGNY